MKHTRALWGFLAICVMTLAVGCAQLGLTAPKTFNEKALAAALTVEQVQKTTTTLLKVDKISQADAENVLKATDAAVAGIAVARSYAKTDPTAGTTKLDAAIAALTLVQTYLATQGAK